MQIIDAIRQMAGQIGVVPEVLIGYGRCVHVRRRTTFVIVA